MVLIKDFHEKLGPEVQSNTQYNCRCREPHSNLIFIFLFCWPEKHVENNIYMTPFRKFQYAHISFAHLSLNSIDHLNIVTRRDPDQVSNLVTVVTVYVTRLWLTSHNSVEVVSLSIDLVQR
jgi:hypothetical protein